MRHKTVIAGIEHRGVQETIDKDRAGNLVDFVFYRLAAARDFDDDVDVLGRLNPGRNAGQIHPMSLPPGRPARCRIAALRRAPALSALMSSCRRAPAENR